MDKECNGKLENEVFDSVDIPHDNHIRWYVFIACLLMEPCHLSMASNLISIYAHWVCANKRDNNNQVIARWARLAAKVYCPKHYVDSKRHLPLLPWIFAVLTVSQGILMSHLDFMHAFLEGTTNALNINRSSGYVSKKKKIEAQKLKKRVYIT